MYVQLGVGGGYGHGYGSERCSRAPDKARKRNGRLFNCRSTRLCIQGEGECPCTMGKHWVAALTTAEIKQHQCGRCSSKTAEPAPDGWGGTVWIEEVDQTVAPSISTLGPASLAKESFPCMAPHVNGRELAKDRTARIFRSKLIWTRPALRRRQRASRSVLNRPWSLRVVAR